MSYVICVIPGTDRCKDFFNYLSANQGSLTRAWPENVGLNEAIKAGVDAEDYGWYINDLQNARSITRVADTDGKKNAQFNIEIDELSPQTPAVLEALSTIINREKHPHIKSAFYLTEGDQRIPVSRKKQPVTFEA